MVSAAMCALAAAIGRVEGGSVPVAAVAVAPSSTGSDVDGDVYLGGWDWAWPPGS